MEEKMSAANVGWREWDERYSSHVIAKRNWQIVAAGSLCVSLVLAVGMVWQSARSRVVPYVVEVDRLGQAESFPVPLSPSSLPELVTGMERYEVAAFIRDARSVTTDPAVEKMRLDELHSRARGAADRYLDDYFHSDGFAHNPFKVAQKLTVAVKIDSILQLSTHSWQIRWTEQTRDLNGVADGQTTQWEAQIQTTMDVPTDADGVVTNPLGFEITNLVWTKQQG
jgi:type IV secretory pathway TrbF-like protein